MDVSVLLSPSRGAAGCQDTWRSRADGDEDTNAFGMGSAGADTPHLGIKAPAALAWLWDLPTLNVLTLMGCETPQVPSPITEFVNHCRMVIEIPAPGH